MSITKITSIQSTSLLRKALTTALLLCLALNVAAQTKPTEGTGTLEDPYQVYTLEHFKWIAASSGGRWKSKTNGGDGHYIQMADIDCNGETMSQPIGNNSVPFSGTYDGNGFAIKNVKIDWSGSDTNGSNVAFGLFGVVSGTVKNLIIDHATVSRNGNNTFQSWTSECTVRLGVLVGSLINGSSSAPATIKNIMVKNSTITDNGTNPLATNYFVGGIIGDMSAGYSSYVALTYIKIENIYSDVDINLSHVTRNTTLVNTDKIRRHQFMVGGVVGRIRNGQEQHVPKNTFYTGAINAPIAMIGPCFGGARFSGGTQYGAYFTLVYAGQYTDAKCWGDGSDAELDTRIDAGKYFADYTIYDPTANSGTGASMTIDQSFITANSGTGYHYGTHTIKPNYPSGDQTDIDYTSAAEMQAFQGVNHGTPITDVSTKYAELSSESGYDWLDSRFGLTMRNQANRWLELNQSGTTFTATIKRQNNDVALATDAYFKWYVIDASGNEKYQLGQTAANANAVNMLLYRDELLKVVLCDAEGQEVKDNGHLVYGILDANQNVDFDITISALSNTNQYPVGVTSGSGVTCTIEHQNAQNETIDTYTGSTAFNLPLLAIPNKLVFIVATGENADRVETSHEIQLDYLAKVEGVLSTTQLPTITTHRYNQNGNEITNLTSLSCDLATTHTFNGGVKSTDGTTYSVKDISTINRQFIATCTDSKGNTIQSEPIVIEKVNITLEQNDYTITAELDGFDASLGSWSWRGISGDILGTANEGHDLSNISNQLSIDNSNDKYDVYRATWKSADGYSVLHGYISATRIIYVFDKPVSDNFKTGKYSSDLSAYPDGNDDNDGRTPRTAVKTMARAYQLLKADNKAENNMIVVMGYLSDDKLWMMYNPGATTSNTTNQLIPSDDYKKNATIVGSYGEITTVGTLVVTNDALGINGATIFKDIILSGKAYDRAAGSFKNPYLLHFYCNLNDLTISTNVKVEDYQKMANNNGLLGNANAPRITIVGGFHQYDNLGPLVYPSGNAVPNQTTLIFQSGNWGRIIASGRTNGLNATSNNVFGHPDSPHRVAVNVAIKHSKKDDGTENRYDYSPGKTYDYDIGMLVGGQTDGTVYVDAKLYMSSGTVGRFVSGNISYGRGTNDGYPSDSFFGSTELTLDGGEIQELVGGTLGRHADTSDNATSKCEAYFYGRSILNINGGTIHDQVYGAGAGGVAGIGTDDHEGYHTKDQNIPYKTGTTDAYGRNAIAYGPYTTAKGHMPTMTLSDGTVVDLADTYSIVNVNGGTIKGNVFGGGYGYSRDIAVERALDQAGDLFGRSYVNVTGGRIIGNVYGAGAGASDYFFHRIAQTYYNSLINAGQNASNAANARTSFINAHKEEWLAGTLTDYVTQDDLNDALNHFHNLANLYGDTELKVTGGIIEGRIFAGSKGIGGLPLMATLNGSTHLTINNVRESDNTTRVPIINGNIYGGSELGEITGSTNVIINGGAMGNSIFGGSEGIEIGNEKTTAHIGGGTNVTITDGTFFTEEHLAQISDNNPLHLTPANRNFNIYGGGYRNCIIDGSTNVTITKSLLTSHKCLLEGRTFMECVADETYRKFSVYGGGRGELTDVKGDANISINIERGATAPSAKPIDAANNQQFFMIAGGGMAGHVWGDTNVELDGNVFARRIYGGGMYGNVLGNANMTVRRGSYYGIFGGGLLGNVKGREKVKGDDSKDNEHAINLQIGTKVNEVIKVDNTEITISAAQAAEANRNLYIYDNVYGGNDVSGCAGYEQTEQLWNDGTYNDFVSASNMASLTAEQKKHHYLFEHWSERLQDYDPNKTNAEQPYYRHLVKASEKRGVNMMIFGGTILGNVFGAGNGNHTGYYVPNNAESEAHKADDYINQGIVTRMKFFEGLPYHYRVNKKDANSYEGTPAYTEATNSYEGTLKSVLNEQVRKDYGLYEYRPRVGKVVMHIGGNSEADRVVIGGEVFGGGHACTIGKYDPTKDVLTDPLRFEGGGSLHMNFGSHVTVKKAVYMGSRGRIIGQQTIVGTHDYNGIELNSDMDYHYYDHNSNKYLLGFPNSLEGRNCFNAYMNLVNMDAVTELSFDEDVSDLRWGSFFAGGARGSMTKLILPEDDNDYDEEKTKPYEYTLPAGLTIETRVVGGSEDAEITYYEYTDNTFTAINYDKPLFTFDGGIVYDDHTVGHFGGGVVKWANAPTGTSDEDLVVGDEVPRGSLVVMKLNVNCQFDPQKVKGVNDNYNEVVGINPDEEKEFEDYYGGLVYGGCYNSGITNGSVEVTCTNNLLGDHFESDDYHDYLSWSSLRHNVGRVYGGGFGTATTILGNTKVTLTDNVRCFNVFGGGMSGDVTGGTDVTVGGMSLVYNAVYGGSLRGNVGKASYDPTTDDDLYAKGTHIRLISGGVDRVYGGGFIGTIYGGTHVTASDEEQPEGTPRLMVGSIFGGNDVSGDVYEDANETIGGTANPALGYSTFIRVNEEPRADKASYTLAHESEKAGEAGKYYGGFPLIGSIYGAGNGNMSDYVKGVYIGQDDHEYSQGLIHIASGTGSNYHTLNLGNRENTGKAFPLPDIAGKTRITVNGGTIINVYGGGSMSTVMGSDEVIVNYTDTVARAANPTAQTDKMTWGVLRLFEDLQQQEVTTIIPEQTVDGVTSPETLRFSYQIYRVFGGNNLMDMAIQPKLDMRRGQIFSVYSGGNFGRMTYLRDTDPNPAADQPRGLNLTIDSEDIRIASVYGGGRVGDIHPQQRVPVLDGEGKTIRVDHIDPATPFAADEFGATLNIKNGLIGEVYGGNNVAGTVHYGTNVNISGAISSNVYGSGNGNYIYYYDYDNSKSDPMVENQITEGYDPDYGGRYFILPKKEAYPGTFYGNSDEEKILAINAYRPNVDKALLNIYGSKNSKVYVRGNVYCGGNSSTVLYDPANETSTPGGSAPVNKIELKIGSYVTLNGVFLGSNGEGLANPFNITYLANLNKINSMAKANDLASKLTETSVAYYDKPSFNTSLYPNLLALYMRAAEVTALPYNFELPANTTEAYIGNFTVGGNYGSMMTDKTINVTLPENLTIFGRIVGGCYNSRLDFQGATALGGMTMPLADGLRDKVQLTIKSKFRPWRLMFDEEKHEAKLVNDRQKRIEDGDNFKYVDVPDAELAEGETYYYTEGKCNTFGGCFTSGKTVGNIKIDLYSDVLGLYEHGGTWLTKDDTALTDAQGRNLQVDRDKLMNNMALRRTVYAVTGAGYGPLTEVEGDVSVRLMPTAQQTSPNSPASPTHPTIATTFGGAHNGKHIGNSVTEIRDGMVFSSVYGGSRAALKYGSSEVIVGYPTYYICKENATFTLDRADKVSFVAQATRPNGDDLAGNNAHPFDGKDYLEKNHDGSQVIKQRVKYHKGEIVAANVVEQMRQAKLTDETEFSDIEDISDYFEKVEITPATLKTLEGSALVSSWDDIDINIGDNRQMNNPSERFYGGGGIYGGGIAINESAQTYSGVNTQLAYTADNNPDNLDTSTAIGFGGNSTIIVGDNPDNAALNADGTYKYALGGSIRDHISIGTGHYLPVAINPTKGDKIGTYALIDGKFVHQSSGSPVAGVRYYKMETDGGIYGDGRRTFVEKFRAVDISGYGYADYAPQAAKLINTFQRIDLLSLNNCCLQLQGATDYATNSVDATIYAIARVGEMRMNSSLTGNIKRSIASSDNDGDMSLTQPRSRNYMGFFKNVHYIGAIYSNTDFTSSYRGSDGAVVASQTYKDFKNAYINQYEASAKSEADTETFKERNLGTAPNMVGINNGYTLKIQNSFTTQHSAASSGSGQGILEEVPEDNIYYGPIVGVVEVKLLTLSPDEGGGYIYAFNQHENKDGGGKTFLEETGNFVFAAKVETDSDKASYIVDDCYPLGYYANASHADDEEIHYWYVQGNRYYFNTTLTGYTYNNPINFFLNNADNLILLSGIEPGSDIRVADVYWQEHVATEQQPVADTDCALTNNLNTTGADSRDNYKLYLTIDKETRDKGLSLHKDETNVYDKTKNAFVARIPNGNNPNADSAPVNDTVQQHNTYAGAENSPILGIRLEDSDTDNQAPDFYKAHLSDPDLCVIKIEATKDGHTYYYTINLTINYLQGPYLSGNLVVENCALPGEYIYANTGKITAMMDESLTVTGKKWYLYPKIWTYNDQNGHEEFTWDVNNPVDVSQYAMNYIAGDANRLQLPARYYQNDWQLGYVIVVNGQEFPLVNETQDIPRLTVHNYHRMSTVAKAIKDMTDATTHVGASNAGYTLDLDLVGGCLVYIEDDEDFEIFTKYVNYCNGFRTRNDWTSADEVYGAENYKFGSLTSPDEPGDIVWQKDKDTSGEHWARVLRAEILPGYNRYGNITGYANNNTVLGYNDTHTVKHGNLKNPSGAEDIRFVLNADVTLTSNTMMIDEFRGNFNGLGHTISFGDSYTGYDFIQRNYGTIRDVGFVSNGGENNSESDITYVVRSNRGIVENCYYYHYPAGHPESTADFSGNKYSALVGANDKTANVPDAVQPFSGKVINSVQNTNKNNANTVDGMRYRENKMFHNGRVAYNLNREYLHARYQSHDNDHQVREVMEIPTYDAATGQYSAGDYLYAFYANGDYRYGNVRSTEHPEGTRLSDNFGVPNYENNLGNERTMHITDEDDAHDNRRWFKGLTRADIIQIDKRGNVEYNFDTGAPLLTNEGYFPIYRYDALDDGSRQRENLADHSDFIFFGQRLTADPADRDYFPRRVNATNRVYRAGGNYGRRTDIGFYFNRDAWALSPDLTAIDFTGQADLRDSDGNLIYDRDWRYYYYYGDGGGAASSNYQKFTILDSEGNEKFTTAQEEAILQMVESGRVRGEQVRMLCYYPPMLDLPGGDQDHNVGNMLDFHIDGNNNIADHTKVTKNLLVYTPAADDSGKYTSADENRLFAKLHYTRMQRWGEPEGETKQDDIIGHHICWTDHSETPNRDAHFHAANGLFHLVDEQDFNAPTEFFVASDDSEQTNGRAWMLRQPKNYASRQGAKKVPGDDYFERGLDAWESIALPFTCNRVLAVNSGDYLEKYSRGEITHFYGSDPDRGMTHHDYWLRGLTEAETDNRGTTAHFARPGLSYTDAGGHSIHLFEVKGDLNEDGTATNEQMRGDYTYENFVGDGRSWFETAYGSEGYVEEHNEYKDSLLFAQYCYLTKNAPYIIAFPGEDYYEFDLSGAFYNQKNQSTGCHRQEILYEFSTDCIDPNNNFDSEDVNLLIPVTDLYTPVFTTTAKAGSLTIKHETTFRHITGSDIKTNMYVLNDEGTAFVNCLQNGITEILPFRTYLTVEGEGSGAPSIAIGSGTRTGRPAAEPDGQPDNDDDNLDNQLHAIHIYVAGGKLHIDSPSDTMLPLYTLDGICFRQLQVNAGRNAYPDLPRGVYVVGRKKVVVR